MKVQGLQGVGGRPQHYHGSQEPGVKTLSYKGRMAGQGVWQPETPLSFWLATSLMGILGRDQPTSTESDPQEEKPKLASGMPWQHHAYLACGWQGEEGKGREGKGEEEKKIRREEGGRKGKEEAEKLGKSIVDWWDKP